MKQFTDLNGYRFRIDPSRVVGISEWKESKKKTTMTGTTILLAGGTTIRTRRPYDEVCKDLGL